MSIPYLNVLSRYFGYGGTTTINDASKGHRHIWNTYQEEYLLIQVLVRWSYHRFSYKPLVVPPRTDDFNDLSVKAWWWYFLLTQLTKGNSVALIIVPTWIHAISSVPKTTKKWNCHRWDVVIYALWIFHKNKDKKKSELTVKKVPIFKDDALAPCVLDSGHGIYTQTAVNPLFNCKRDAAVTQNKKMGEKSALNVIYDALFCHSKQGHINIWPWFKLISPPYTTSYHFHHILLIFQEY